MRPTTYRRPLYRLLLLCLAVVAGLTGCQRGEGKVSALNEDVLATPDHSVPSPSGRYVLKVLAEKHDGEKLARFQVLNGEGSVSYEDGTKYSLRHTTYFLWADDIDQVWVYSGDVGTSFWQVDENGTWTEHDRTSEQAEVPTFLKRARPQFFGT